MKNFESLYKELNIRQKQAVDSIEGSVMVIAGPGTGKTTILTLRIANILRLTDVGPSGILALTFTDAGVKAMRSKLKDIIGETALEIPIFTFHGFASSVISEFNEYFPHLKNVEQITEIESEEILRSILKSKKYSLLRPIGEPDYYLSAIQKSISDSKKEAWTPEMLRAFAKEEKLRIKNDPLNISTRGQSKGKLKGDSIRKIEKCEKTIIFSFIYEEYEKIKKLNKKIDFDDLIFELLKELRKKDLLLQILQEKYIYILVDEHQDTNDSQNIIIETIANFFDNPNLFIVGDEKQAIYRFQGASIENFLKFQKTWKNMKVITLKENYRSHQNIIDSSHQVIENNYKDNNQSELKTKLISKTKQEKRLINVVSFENADSEEFFLAKKINEVLKSERDAKIAIITRKNSQVSRLYNLLNTHKIDVSAERGANIFEHFIGHMFFNLLQYVKDPSNLEPLAETFAMGLWGLSFSERVDLLKDLKNGKLDKVHSKIPDINNIILNISKMGSIEYLIYLGKVSGLESVSKINPLYMEVWRAIISLSEEISYGKKIYTPHKLIEELLLYKKTSKKRVIKVSSGKLDSKVTVMTAHSSKGLEFDYVFLPYATEESWITKSFSNYFIFPKEKEVIDNIRDERRLFYVSMTRAKKHIYITHHEIDHSGKNTETLRFIEEIEIKNLERIKIKDSDLKKENNIIADKSDELHKEMGEYAKRIILEKGISVTALNHFLNCPKQFFYKSILKVPEAPSATSEKGKAMHEAISNIWESKNKDKSTILKIITDTIHKYFTNSLLAKHEKESIIEELEKNAPTIAESLHEHFLQKGKVETEKWVENYIPYKKGEINIKLHGKLDAILENEKNIFIYDYKTREGLSMNSIKGLNVGSDGSYFRQLIFYKILLRKKNKEKTIDPYLVFLKPKRNSNICEKINLPITESDEKRVYEEILYLIDTVWKNKLFENKCKDLQCKYCYNI